MTFWPAVLLYKGHKASGQIVPAKGRSTGDLMDFFAGFDQLVSGGGNR